MCKYLIHTQLFGFKMPNYPFVTIYACKFMFVIQKPIITFPTLLIYKYENVNLNY